jgi:flavin reductase (DIM6/NTAB) family NADH-FMN oxidoreductase RutF
MEPETQIGPTNRVKTLPISKNSPASGTDRERPPLVAHSLFVKAMSNVASSVTIVTTDGPGGRFGQTVSSFCSVSADPPQMLCCIRATTPIREAIELNGCFAINVLSECQSDVSDAFAGRSTKYPVYDFSRIPHGFDENGCPLIEGASSLYSCQIASTIVSGTHVICIGNVTSAKCGADAPLLYRSRGYGRHVVLERSQTIA